MIMNKTHLFKHRYAFNQFKQIVEINEAQKNNGGEKYYKDIDLTIEFILVHGSIKEKHFRQPKEYFINTRNGIISNNKINESPEHYNFKMQIIKDGYFIFNDYKIFIKEPKDEYILTGSKYRIDLYAKLLCDTPIAIEIIKTSDISLAKENYLKENEILTFKIYINNEGCQELNQFNIYGKREIEQLKDEIIRAERDNTTVRTKVGIQKRNFETKFKAENDYLQNQYRQYIENQDARIDKFKASRGESTSNAEYEVRNLREKILHTIQKIKEFRTSPGSKYESIQNEIGKLEKFIKENKYYKSSTK